MLRPKSKRRTPYPMAWIRKGYRKTLQNEQKIYYEEKLHTVIMVITPLPIDQPTTDHAPPLARTKVAISKTV